MPPRSVTLALPVAMPLPEEPVFCTTVLPLRLVVPRLEIPPPSPPEVLRETVVSLTRVVPPGWVDTMNSPFENHSLLHR